MSVYKKGEKEYMVCVSGQGREKEGEWLEVPLYRMDSGQERKLHGGKGEERRWQRKGLVQRRVYEKYGRSYDLWNRLSLASTMIPAIRSTHSWVCVQLRVLSMTSRIAGKYASS